MEKDQHKKGCFRIKLSSHHKELQPRSKSGPQLYSASNSLFKKKKVTLKIGVRNNVNRISISNQKVKILSMNNEKERRAVSDSNRSSLGNRSSGISELTKKKDYMGGQSQLKQMLSGIAEGQRQLIGMLKQSMSQQNKQNRQQKQEPLEKEDLNESIMDYYEKKCQFYENIIKHQKKPSSRRDRRSSHLRISSRREPLDAKSHYSMQLQQKQDFMDFMPKIIQSILKTSSSMYQADYVNREKSLINLRELLLNRLAYYRKTYSHFVEEILQCETEEMKFLTLKSILEEEPYSLKVSQVQFLMKQTISLTEPKTKPSVNLVGQDIKDTTTFGIEAVLNLFRQLLPSKVKYSKREIAELLNSFKQKLNLRSQQITYKLQQFESSIGIIHLTYLQKTLIEFSEGFFEPSEVNAIKMFACVNSENIEEIEYDKIFSILLENTN